MLLVANSLNDLPLVARSLLTFAGSHRVFLIHGEMGVGKTTLIKEICRALGCKENMSSPTYSIVNEYQCPDVKIFHFDLYRLKNQVELADIGFEEYVDSGHYCFIEWPNLATDLLNSSFVSLSISETNNTRKIEVNIVT